MSEGSCKKIARRFVYVFIIAVIFLISGFVASPRCAAQEVVSGARKLVRKVQPEYPILVRRNNMSGVVKLRVTVDLDDRPEEVSVVGGNPVFVDSATESVKKWKWSPSDHATTEILELRFNPS
jgi:TonB family protein